MDDLREIASRFCFTKLHMQNKKEKKIEKQIRREKVEPQWVHLFPSHWLQGTHLCNYFANTITSYVSRRFWVGGGGGGARNWTWKVVKSFTPKTFSILICNADNLNGLKILPIGILLSFLVPENAMPVKPRVCQHKRYISNTNSCLWAQLAKVPPH